MSGLYRSDNWNENNLKHLSSIHWRASLVNKTEVSKLLVPDVWLRSGRPLEVATNDTLVNCGKIFHYKFCFYRGSVVTHECSSRLNRRRMVKTKYEKVTTTPVVVSQKDNLQPSRLPLLVSGRFRDYNQVGEIARFCLRDSPIPPVRVQLGRIKC